jgi:SAM-dependent methyltransferase
MQKERDEISPDIPFAHSKDGDIADAQYNMRRVDIYKSFYGENLGGKKSLYIGKPDLISRGLNITDYTFGNLNEGIMVEKKIDGIPGVPFTKHGDASDQNANKGKRVRIVGDFIGNDLENLKTLDIGGKNKFGELLGIRDNTSGNLNEGVIAPSNTYDFILCSEILEHLMNPLQVMREIMELLRPGGICIVSTPIEYKIGWYQSEAHFVEYRPDRLKKLFEYVGFEILDYKKFCIWDWWPFMFTGVRPFLRCLLHRSQLWKLRKPSS